MSASIATRLYTVALRAFPRAHRSVYAADMVETFERGLAAERSHGGAPRALRFVIASLLDVVREGLGERRRLRRAFSGGRSHAFGGVGHDLVHAARSLAKARAFTFVCVTSLGIGMGVVLVILVVMQAITSPPPGVNARGLVELLLAPREGRGGMIDTWAHPAFEELRRADPGMAVTGWTLGEGILRLRGGEGAMRLPAMYVSNNYFSTVGPPIARGLGLANESAAAGAPVVVMSHRLWHNHFGSDPGILGATITLNRVDHVVAGVAPPRFRGHVSPEESRAIDLWLPLRQHPRLVTAAADGAASPRDEAWIRVLARLPEGMSMADAAGTVSAVLSDRARRDPGSSEPDTALVEPYSAMGARYRDEAAVATTMMVGLAGMVLFIVCLNVSGMVLVRSATRERELAVRLAIGASRGRLIQYLLSEAIVLALASGALAALVVFGAPAALTLWYGTVNPNLDVLTPDGWMLGLCLGLCFVTSLVFGLVPAIRFSRPKVIAALKEEAGGGRRRVGRIHRFTAAIQAGIAVPLLVIGGVRLDQVRTTATADLGFEPRGLFTAPLDVTAAGEPEERAALAVRSVRDTLAQAPGVTSVTLANGTPLDFRSRYTGVSRDGDSTLIGAHTTRVADGYFETMKIRMLRGRGITADDRAGAELVTVVSEPLAAKLAANGDVVGQRVRFEEDGNEPRVYTVVGVTADVVSSQMGNPRPQLFVSLAQHPTAQLVVIARGQSDEAAMTAAFQSAFRNLDPDFNRASLTTGEQLVRKSMRDLIGHSIMAAVGASVALMLAALGVYGVVGFMVATRTREIGVRIALGASPGRVLRTVLGDAAKVVIPGVALGLLIAVGWVRSADPSWYPLGGVEPAAYILGIGIALTVAVLAGLPSARRAAGVEPLIAMRSE